MRVCSKGIVMTEYTTIRVSKEFKAWVDAEKGDKTVEGFLRNRPVGVVSDVWRGDVPGKGTADDLFGGSERVVGVGVKCDSDPELLKRVGEILEKVQFLYAEKRKYPGVKGNGVGRQKSKDSILLEFEAWSNTYLSGWGGKAREYTEGHLKAVKVWLEGLELETETVTGPGGE